MVQLSNPFHNKQTKLPSWRRIASLKRATDTTSSLRSRYDGRKPRSLWQWMIDTLGRDQWIGDSQRQKSELLFIRVTHRWNILTTLLNNSTMYSTRNLSRIVHRDTCATWLLSECSSRFSVPVRKISTLSFNNLMFRLLLCLVYTTKREYHVEMVSRL